MANAELTRGLYAVRRAQKGTGVDYYLGPAGSTPEDLETSMRLEVSGTDEGSIGTLLTRLKQKLEQAGRVDDRTEAGKPWSPKLGLPRAIEETESWLMRLHLLAHCA